MKIAFIVNRFPTLSQTFILNQITGLLDLGHDVEMFAQFNPNEKRVHSDVKKYSLMRRVHYFFDDMIFHNKIKRVLKAICLIITNFHKSPHKILKSLNVFRYGRSAVSLNLLFALICFLNRKFDIIHCHFGPNGIIGVQLKEIGIPGKLITTFYGFDLTSFLNEKGEKVYSDLFAKGDLFLPICNYFHKKLISLNCDEKKILIHHIGADIESFPLSDRRIGQIETIKMLTISRLVEKKGHQYALMAFKEIINEHENIKYIIAGDGPLRSQLEILVAEWRLADRVEFTGAVNYQELKALLQEAHIFVLPSITTHDGDQEGTPTILVEAQAAGLPVISTYHSGIPEVIVDGKSGFLVPEKDVDALAERIEYLIEHPEIWAQMGQTGREFIEKHYDIKKLNKRLVQIYKGLLFGTS